MGRSSSSSAMSLCKHMACLCGGPRETCTNRRDDLEDRASSGCWDEDCQTVLMRFVLEERHSHNRPHLERLGDMLPASKVFLKSCFSSMEGTTTKRPVFSTSIMEGRTKTPGQDTVTAQKSNSNASQIDCQWVETRTKRPHCECDLRGTRRVPLEVRGGRAPERKGRRVSYRNSSMGDRVQTTSRWRMMSGIRREEHAMTGGVPEYHCRLHCPVKRKDDTRAVD